MTTTTTNTTTVTITTTKTTTLHLHHHQEAPVIIGPPKDTYGPVGANLTLDCEVSGCCADKLGVLLKMLGQLGHQSSLKYLFSGAICLKNFKYNKV